jgi:hypothetical protein
MMRLLAFFTLTTSRFAQAPTFEVADVQISEPRYQAGCHAKLTGSPAVRGQVML